VLEKISKNIRSFLWEGGKPITNKFHLVNWKMVRKPLDKGGLAFRDLALMNVSLGAKIEWRLISRDSKWWKNLLIYNYFSKSRP